MRRCVSTQASWRSEMGMLVQSTFHWWSCTSRHVKKPGICLLSIAALLRNGHFALTDPMTPVANANSQQCLSPTEIGAPPFSPLALVQGSEVFYASPQLLQEQASVAVGDHAFQNGQPQIHCGFDYSANATAYGGVWDPMLQQIPFVSGEEEDCAPPTETACSPTASRSSTTLYS